MPLEVITSFPVTGAQLAKIEDLTVRKDSNVFGLHVYRDTLIVSRCGDRKVLFYQLK